MYVRNLTENNNNRSNENSQDSFDNLNNNGQQLSNPFMGSDEDNLESGSSSSLDFNNTTNNTNNLDNSHISDYKGYYSKNASALNQNNNSAYLMPPRSANSPLPQINSPNSMEPNTNEIFSPPEFDRYPLLGSRVSSQANLQSPSNANSPNPMSYGSPLADNSNASFSSSNPFNGEQDFSPFGGYPTSSFPLLIEEKEEDDYLHNPDPEEEARLDRRRFIDDFKHMDRKSAGGILGVFTLIGAGIAIFVILPALTFTGVTDYGSSKGEVIDYLTSYQYPRLAAIRTELVDPDTPSSAKTRKAKDGSNWKLVFSDEFNAEGRTFYAGDDQFWTAPDIHYDATKDLEWYDPDASTTVNGTLQLRMDAFKNHDLYYRSGMLQSWNKLCFTQGMLEISANLPNYGRVTGLWPGLWTMGNLGRPGYLGSTEGVWPYSYESCDAGITPNQSSPDGISYLPGQKLNACTCDGEDHPNQGVGRGAPEIDIIEGEVDTTLNVGVASQSMQIAPFDIWYMPDYDFIEVYNFSTTNMNSYAGGPFQQAVSAVSTLNTTWYEFGQDAGYFQTFGIEYLNDDTDGYCRWFVGDNPTFTIYANALHPNGNIGWRRISKEPMSIIMNLGISNNWAYIDWRMIFFPVKMSVDYVRLYQPSDAVSVTCDPEGYPTYDYIEDHLNIYSNPNLTSWSAGGYTYPKNQLTGNCESSKFQSKEILL
ncbi:similar to Saccharomyces cerevisiae YGR143W SKN1 Protein involved in sphingolipid biosynthesis [Maudiozyma saulgeensis]|uniref:Similar to Saccharomyces cerevisiae YGR143W SKN1 Protein involved in sphingolipid biosynthesis n=1 Tax=Maudiozyma saulgeensis TaxID=1789683 RepID=A0A1X7QWY6_9SACH|nr:similar to Saccharomyces cerevisiae YGR143W SKN1 Protein involved in sphingolipid biosynthesis [Kazachstania saulgeensis]